uniref:Uncharacterized protein n=1 Tax=Timema bartmani TaxID=61472 RepID=A0A7R9F7P6_9NEOP|nr:unnamed protein product [Timema bartmani]
MERETITVKFETEENLEYDIHHEDKFEIKSELDLHINSEECIKEEVHDSQQPECLPELIILPSIKEELPKHQVLSLLGQYGTSQTIFKGVILDSVENKINKVTHEEDKFYKYPKGGGKSLRHIVTCVEKICDEKGCSIQVRMGGECWKHGETEAKNTNKEEGFSNQVDGGGKYYFYGNTKAKKKTCKEEECSKWAVGGGKCIKHGGTQVKNTCKVEGCFKQAQMVEPVKKKGALNSLGEEVNVGIMEEPRLRKPVEKTGALNGLWEEVNVLNMEAPGLRISVKKEGALNGLEGEELQTKLLVVTVHGKMSYLTDTAQGLRVMKQGKRISMIKPTEVLPGVRINAAMIKDVHKLLEKHYGNTWGEIENLKGYQKIINEQINNLAVIPEGTHADDPDCECFNDDNTDGQKLSEFRVLVERFPREQGLVIRLSEGA